MRARPASLRRRRRRLRRGAAGFHRRALVGIGLPAAAERLVQGDERMERIAINLHARQFRLLQRLLSAALCEPYEPVSETVGNSEALTACSRALEPINVFSDCRMSGRRSINVAGNPTGTSGGTGK